MARNTLSAIGQRLHRFQGIGWAALSLGGLLLALVSTLGPPEGPVAGSPAVRLVLTVPEPLQMALVALFALVTVLALGLILPRRLRRRGKKDEDAFELVHEEPKPSVWGLVILLILTLVPVGLTGYFLWTRWTSLAHVLVPALHSGISESGQPPLLPEAVRPVAASPIFNAAMTALALLAGLGALSVVLWIYLGDRIIGGWVGPSAETRQELAEVVEESLESLRQEPDPRRAIIRCYRRFEQVLARSGLARAPWKTPTEFLRQTLRRFALPAEPVTTLTSLFEVSRFSHHSIGAAERDVAVESLGEIKAALEQRKDIDGSVS